MPDQKAVALRGLEIQNLHDCRPRLLICDGAGKSELQSHFSRLHVTIDRKLAFSQQVAW